MGKSVIATALCRCFVNRGIRTAPYKAQNMSNNSGVTPEGLEMGRAQIVQAEAARIAPHVDMNPVLLKPTSEIGSQVVLLGRVSENTTAADYHRRKEALFKTAAQALDRLRGRFDAIVMEGAGSCAEVNLMAGDIVNLRMAGYARAPVILVADIHRGGVFAQIVGTLACLAPEWQALIRGFIINRFRGDIDLFADGVEWIEQKTGKKVFGVLPWYDHIHIESEDSVVIEQPERIAGDGGDAAAIAVIRLPHISNFNDFDPLAAVEGLAVRFLKKPQQLFHFQAVILPGSKNTRFDLDWLGQSGWRKMILDYAGQGGHVLGICGGYQMMGRCVHDPDGIEGPPGKTDGLGLLPVETRLQAPKTTTRTRFRRQDIDGSGYEIHMGRTVRSAGSALFEVLERNGTPVGGEDGCIVADSGHMGTYIHGLFENPAVIAFWLRHIGLDNLQIPGVGGLDARDRQYDRLAAHFETHIDMDAILELI